MRRTMGLLALTTLFASLISAAVTAHGVQGPTIELDIPFVPDGGHDQQLDLYLPAGDGFPTILFVHEGSLTSGDRKDEPYARMCRTFTGLGIGCAAISYRLAPAHAWPAQPDDVAAAFRWLKDNIAARGGDSERIFLFGHSSGCLLVAIVAADARYLDKQGLGPQDIAGVVPMGCRLDDRIEVADHPPDRYEASWAPADRVGELVGGEGIYAGLEQRNDAVPAAHVSDRLPPTLVLVAQAERFFPPILRDGAEFVGRALASGVDADLVILDDRTHMTAIRMMVTADDPAVARVAQFVGAH